MYEIKKEENMKIFARLHAGEKRDIGVEEGQREKNEDEEMSLTLTMCERQVHWYGCNALSIRLVSHVANIPIWPWYHLVVCLFLASVHMVMMDLVPLRHYKNPTVIGDPL